MFGEEFKQFLAPCDVVWHAGDFGGGFDFVESIRNFKPLVGVHGNCDGMDTRREFPEYQSFTIEGVSVLMMHIGGSPGHYYPRAAQLLDAVKPQIFVCGHSHILKVMNDAKRNLLYINPGAAGRQGWQPERTALRFKIEKGNISDMEVFRLPMNA